MSTLIGGPWEGVYPINRHTHCPQLIRSISGPLLSTNKLRWIGFGFGHVAGSRYARYVQYAICGGLASWMI
jgi:hypothetical protein